MTYKTLAVAFGALMVLVALGPAASAQAPGSDTFNLVGGALVLAAVNVVPQELDGDGRPANQDYPDGQLLQTTDTYDCTTGKIDATSEDRYSFDAVQIQYYGNGLGPNDNLVNEFVFPFTGGQREDPEYVYYGAIVALGFGAEKPAAFYPGLVSFYAFLLCGGEHTGTVPVPAVKTAAMKTGVFAWQDEGNWSGTAQEADPLAPEFTFTFRARETDTSGKPIAPGNYTPQEGWYMDSYLLSEGLTTTSASTWRFAVNPVTTTLDVYPGYANSRFAGYTGETCFVNADAEDSSESGAFNNCGAGSPLSFQAPEPYMDANVPAPVLEDIDTYGLGDLGLGAVESLNYEAFAAVDFADAQADAVAAAVGAVVNPIVDPIVDPILETTPDVVIESEWEMEPNQPGEEAFNNLSAGANSDWRYYLDVRKQMSFGFASAETEVLYENGLSSARDIYPGFANFHAVLGLAFDADADGSIAFNETEWYPISDMLTLGTIENPPTINWADVGSMEEGGSTLEIMSVQDIVVLDYCLNTVTPVTTGPGVFIPIGNTQIDTCNPNGDPETGYGMFIDSGPGEYYTQPDYLTTQGSQGGEWKTSVKARIVWPSIEEWNQVVSQLPPAMNLDYDTELAGKTVFLQDIDVWGPTLIAA